MSTDAKETPDNVVMMPDIYTDKAANDQPKLEVVELSAQDDGESEGFNPYDTGRLQKHKIERSKG